MRPRNLWKAALAALLLASPALSAPEASQLPVGATVDGRILMLEDQRVLDLGDGLADLKYYIRSADQAVRARAILAAGRIGDPAAFYQVRTALHGGPLVVRRAAAFALGEMGSDLAAGTLRRALHDPDAEVRALAAEALSKLDAAGALPALKRLLAREAAGGSAEVAERILLTAWRLKPEGWTGVVLPLLDSPDPRVADAAAYFLRRRPDHAALERLTGVLADDGPNLRKAWAALALGGMNHPAAAGPLLQAAGDPDPIVAVAALNALGGHPRAAGAPRLLAAAARPELHVRLAALGAIEAMARRGGDGGPDTSRLLEERLDAGDPEGGLALEALARVAPDVALPNLQRIGSFDKDWWMRATAADALAWIPGQDAAQVLDLLLEDEDPRVVWHALAAWAERIGDPPDKETAARVAEMAMFHLQHDDVVVRAVAANALDRSGYGGWEEFASCFLGALDDAINDAALACMHAAAGVGTSAEMHRGLDRVMQSPDPVIRQQAGRLWEKYTGTFPRHLVYPIHRNREVPFDTENALRAYSALASGNLLPRTALLRFEGGLLRMDLFPDESPLTVYNFVRLARSGYYAGLPLHRVVPGFVAQGGDPRGDGWGGPGYAIRDEINLHRYEAGAVGMALSGPDTGGSQFFVALTPQPHLDGGYTVFGRVNHGLESLRRVRRGARILEIRLID